MQAYKQTIANKVVLMHMDALRLDNNVAIIIIKLVLGVGIAHRCCDEPSPGSNPQRRVIIANSYNESYTRCNTLPNPFSVCAAHYWLLFQAISKNEAPAMVQFPSETKNGG